MYHSGIDISSIWRAQVVSVTDGVIEEHWPPPGTRSPSGAVFGGHPVYGGLIVVSHDDGSRSLYAHLSETFVHEGVRVKPGTVIGRVGNTGKSTGEHLHFELEIDGQRVNPLHYIEQTNN
jgi:murein DD-endopeptidase MepM/ murein hydrolase activator NlpD